MGIYAGAEGVLHQAASLSAGVAGVRHNVTQGFCGVNGVRRQFFGALAGLDHVEVRAKSIEVSDIDSSGNLANRTSSSSAAFANAYGTVTVTNSTVRVTCTTTGKWIFLSSYACAVFADGHEVSLNYLSESSARYGAAIEFPVNCYVTFYYAQTVCGIYCCGIQMSPESWGSNSGTMSKTLTAFSSNTVNISVGIKSGSGSISGEFSFTSIAIDGTSYPVKVVSKLT